MTSSEKLVRRDDGRFYSVGGITLAEVDADQFRMDYKDLSIQEVADKYGVSGGTVNTWARKLDIPRKNGQWRDVEFTFNDRQMSVIAGSMLGDGTLHKVQNPSRNSRFDEIHGISQYDWLVWKQKALEPLPSLLKEGESEARKNLGGGVIVTDTTRTYKNCNLRTIACPYFTDLEKVWYKRDEDGEYIYKTVGKKKHRIKVVPPDLKLDPLTLAVWYMDDGSNGIPVGRKQCNLACLSFTEEEVARLLDEIRRMGFGDAEMYEYKNHKQFCINIRSKSILDFLDLIKQTVPDLPDCMKYKVDTSEWKVSWKDSPDYHPQSVLNDELVEKIMGDARQKVKQREIAKKYDIDYKLVNSLLRGRLRYKSDFNKVNYASTTGVEGVTFNEERNRYVSQIMLHHPDGRPYNLCLGYYQDKETAVKAANESRQMRNEGITDPLEYKKMRKKYQSPVRSTNKSGVNGLHFSKNKWHAGIRAGGNQISLGSFTHKEDAVKVLEEAKQLKAAGVVDREQYVALRPAENKKYKDLPKGVSKKGKQYVAYYKREWRRYFNTLDEAIEARKLAEQGAA